MDFPSVSRGLQVIFLDYTTKILEGKNINECFIQKDITEHSVEKSKEIISTVD